MAAHKRLPEVVIIMGSQSDYPTMVHAENTLKSLNVQHEVLIISAHRTPKRLYDFASTAYDRGARVIIAGAGGSAHLPGMASAISQLCQVHCVPCPSSSNWLNDDAAVKSMAFMPPGVPGATHSIGKAGAINAALDAAKFVAKTNAHVRHALRLYFLNQTREVPERPDPSKLKEAKK